MERTQVAALYVRGVSFREICAIMGRSISTIDRDLKAIRARWRESQVADFTEHVNKELARIDAVEFEAWNGWMESKGERRTEESAIIDGKQRTRLQRVTEPTGDPRFLAVVSRCIDQRVKLLGLEAPQRHEIDWGYLRREAEAISKASGMSVDDVMAEVEAILRPGAPR